jgi:hypothetical protein
MLGQLGDVGREELIHWAERPKQMRDMAMNVRSADQVLRKPPATGSALYDK